METLTATKVVFFLVCAILTPELQGKKKGLNIIKEWKQLDYAYSSEEERQQAINSGEFIPINCVPFDMDVHYGPNYERKIFVTVSRMNNGIPATLNTVSQQENNGNPLLEPFPSWEWHQNSNMCNQDRIVSVFRVKLDECGRLWVLDTGKIDSNQLCPPQIIAFNPETAEVLHRYEIPKDQILNTTLLITPVVDVRDPYNTCQDTFVYSADVTGFGIIVYDVQNRKSWRIQNKLFKPNPKFGIYTIAGESFDLMDGIFGMTLSPYRPPSNPRSDRILYFHSLASNTENYVHTSIIRNETLFKDDSEAVPKAFHVFHDKRHSQAAAEAMDEHGVLYFGGTSEISMMCWNSNKKFEKKNFDTVDNNKKNLQFASGVKIVESFKDKGRQELWVFTCRFQKVMAGTLNPKETNFRILAGQTDFILRGTKCTPKNRP